MPRTRLSLLFFLLIIRPFVSGAERYVSLNGVDTADGSQGAPWRTIQRALDLAEPGDVIAVAAGEYNEAVRFKRSGMEGMPIVLKAEKGAVISAKGVKAENVVHIQDTSHVQVIGFEIRDLKARDGSGIRVLGAGHHIELRNNRIHEIRGKDAMGITIYGTNQEQGIEHIIIDGNEIYDCEPARSEALTLNGNVAHFEVTNNRVHDVNNIGIDFIGGEAWTNGNPAKVAREGVCRGNVVARCRSNYEDGYAAGIYVDGGVNITLENNIVTQCDLGIEIGAENKGSVATGIVVKNNYIFLNDKAGLVFGGFEKSVGRVQGCRFIGNTCYHNNRHKEDHNGELWIQWASENEVTDNTFVVNGSDSPLAQIVAGGSLGNKVDNNRYFTDAGAADAFFLYKGNDVNGFHAWRTTTRLDANSVFGPVEVKLPAVE